MNWRDHVETKQEIMNGRPVVKGTDLTAEFLLNGLAEGMTIQQALQRYPQVSPEAMKAVFALAAESVHRKHPPRTPVEFFEGPEWTEVAPGVRVRPIPDDG